MSSTRALIAGASIAGPALAFWLRRYGWQVTVVERAPELRLGGQNIDVRGAGREVLRRMGLEEAVRAATTGEVGTRFLDTAGGTVAEFPAGTSDTEGATAELEILRGDLARLLVDATADGADYVWGDRITGVADGADAITASFEHSASREFDLVVAADGIRSSTRELALGGEADVRSLGMYIAWFTMPRDASDDDWWRWYNATGGRSITLRPDNHGTIRAAVSYQSPPDGSELAPADEQRRRLRRRFAGVGWQAERVLDAMDAASDFTYDGVGQVRAPRWSTGRFALVGDAAYCASPVSGMGTSLSLVGAYVLAGELAAHVDPRDAFRGYERVMRPYVDQAQKLPPGVPGVANPKTRAGIAAFHTALRVAASPVGARLTGLFSPLRTRSTCRTTPTSSADPPPAAG